MNYEFVLTNCSHLPQLLTALVLAPATTQDLSATVQGQVDGQEVRFNAGLPPQLRGSSGPQVPVYSGQLNTPPTVLPGQAVTLKLGDPLGALDLSAGRCEGGMSVAASSAFHGGDALPQEPIWKIEQGESCFSGIIILSQPLASGAPVLKTGLLPGFQAAPEGSVPHREGDDLVWLPNTGDFKVVNSITRLAVGEAGFVWDDAEARPRFAARDKYGRLWSHVPLMLCREGDGDLKLGVEDLMVTNSPERHPGQVLGIGSDNFMRWLDPQDLGAGGAAGTGNAASPAQITLDAYGAGSLRTQTVGENGIVHFSWQRRTLNFAGVTLPGDVQIRYLALYGPNRYEGHELSFSPQDLKRTFASGVTTYLLPEAHLLTDGYLDIGLQEGTQLRLRESLPLPTATQLQFREGDDTPTDVNLELFAVHEMTYTGVRVVPEPTSNEVPYTGSAFDSPPRRVELVWPKSGSPYLHVVQFNSVVQDGRHFHVLLTPGLPE